MTQPSRVVFGERRPRRSRWLIPLAVALLLLPWLRTLRERPVRMPVPISQRTAAALDVVMILDDSGSEYGPNGTDGEGLRYRGARSAVNVLAAQGIGYDDRLGIVHFGDDTVSDGIFHHLDSDGLTGLQRALRVPPSSLGGTQFHAAFDAVTKFEKAPSGRKRVVVLFTDGVASDSSQQIDASLHSLGRVSLRVFLFNRSAAARSQFGEARKFWAARATSVDVLTDLRGNRVERSFALAIYRQLGVQTR